MLGTRIGALEVRLVTLAGDDVRCDVEGANEVRDGLPVLTAVRVRFRLRVPPGSREAVERALARHQDKCPTAASLRGAVAVSWTAEIEEAGVPAP